MKEIQNENMANVNVKMVEKWKKPPYILMGNIMRTWDAKPTMKEKGIISRLELE
ncbi:hypothetical protein [Pasteuria penetrans]|uniref:hypothetical protein n=1 Tax=Pasteuria penetrans TaxID=86005 RepID=UPI00165B1BE3|nr:hypothetical protein [Pasteuria penetrans]